MLTYTSKQADKARSSNHFRNKDKQFNPYYRIHQIQLISSKVTPESKIVLALHFIYSYEGITGNQDSLFIPLVSTLVTRPLHTFTSKTLLKPLPSFTTTCLLFMKQVISIWFCCYFLPYFCGQTSKPESAALSNDSFFCSQVLKVLVTLENLHTLCCKHLKLFQGIIFIYFLPFNAGVTALSEANYILHSIAFVIFHIISLEQAMKLRRGNVLLEKKIRRTTPFWTSGTKLIKTLT